MRLSPLRRSVAAAARLATPPTVALRPGTSRGPRIESLEARQLMSAAHLTDMVAAPMTTALPAIGTVPVGSTSPVGYSPAQIRGAYGITGTGAGQTIAIVAAYDNPKFVNTGSSSFNSSDLHVFDAKYGIADPPSFKKVSEYGTTGYPSTDPNGGWDNEIALDVEWTHAVAPSANLLLVECNSASLDDLIATGVNYARSQPGVSVVTMSFAAGEASGETAYDTYFSTPGGHPGVTFVAASGDGGSPGGYPAFSPRVLSVGATTLSVNGNSYAGEVGRTKSGGGYSTYEAKPSFQNSVNSSSRRASPDVSIDGDPNTGVSVYDSFNGGSSNGWYKVGGTSFSAPAWAGLVAEADQARASARQSPYDGPSGLLPRVYAVPQGDFHDVTSGNNGYAAGTGYDLVTGRGTPIAGSLIPALANVTSTTPTPTPTPTPTATGVISGTVYTDANHDGKLDDGESGTSGRTVYLDFNGNGKLDSGETTAVSNSAGVYVFSGLKAGITWTVRQVVPGGYTQTGTGVYYVPLSGGQVVENDNFGSYAASTSTGTGVISGTVYNDANHDGKLDNGESGVAGRTVFLDYNGNGKVDSGEPTATSNSAGVYVFSGLKAGITWTVRQVVPSGYTQTGSSVYYVPLSSGQVVENDNFGTYAAVATTVAGSISGTVFNDTNRNGKLDGGDYGVSGRTVYLDYNGNGKLDSGEATAVTNSAGVYVFGGLKAGITWTVRQVLPSGKTQSAPSGGQFYVPLSSGQNVTGDNFGSY